jgi:hypothetical protein
MSRPCPLKPKRNQMNPDVPADPGQNVQRIIRNQGIFSKTKRRLNESSSIFLNLT